MMIKAVSAYHFQLPLHPPVVIRGGVLTHREGFLLAVETDAGATRWGEASPLPGFSHETPTEVLDAAGRFARQMPGLSLEEARHVLPTWEIGSPALRFALETALTGLNCASIRVPLCALATGGKADITAQVEGAVNAGYGVVKVKVGAGTVAADIMMAQALHARFAGTCRFRYDANRAWSYEDARRFSDGVMHPALDYIEEPLAQAEALPKFQEESGAPIAVDETLQELGRCLFSPVEHGSQERIALLRECASRARVLVWKPSLCPAPHHMGIASNAPVALSGSYESGLGTAAVLVRAVSDGHVSLPPGIDTYSRLADDVLVQRLPIHNGGVNMDAVLAAAASPDINKLRRVWRVQ